MKAEGSVQAISPRQPRRRARTAGASGRGITSNESGRFERWAREAYDDGWTDALGQAERRGIATQVTVDSARSVISRNDSPDIPFDRSVNPYRGCEHGCVYCFARPSHAYLGLSPGLDFESKLFSKPEAARLLAKEFSRRGYQPQTLALGSNTDPYQPIERRLGITRSILELALECAHPVSITTKSDLVLRDLDLLRELARRSLICVAVSLTTLQPDLAGVMEPRAATPRRRLEAIRALGEAGIPVQVLTSPMIPALNDHELEQLLEQAADAGATSAGYVLLRLPLELKALFREWLDLHFPARRARVLRLVAETRGGSLYESEFGTRMRGRGVYADLLETRFRRALARLGLDSRPIPLDSSQFLAPTKPAAQLSLFPARLAAGPDLL